MDGLVEVTAAFFGAGIDLIALIILTCIQEHSGAFSHVAPSSCYLSDG